MEQPPPSDHGDTAVLDPALATATALNASALVPAHEPLSKDAANNRWAGSKIESHSAAQPQEDSKEVLTTSFLLRSFLHFSLRFFYIVLNIIFMSALISIFF